MSKTAQSTTETKTALFRNTATGETYRLGGVQSLEQAWRLVDFAAERNGWDAADVTVTLQAK